MNERYGLERILKVNAKPNRVLPHRVEMKAIFDSTFFSYDILTWGQFTEACRNQQLIQFNNGRLGYEYRALIVSLNVT